MEAQFHTSCILLDETKYNYIIQSLDDDSLSEVSDIVLNSPATEQYETLKNRLIKSYAESAQKKLRTFLSDIDLGDRKPSQLLRRMRDLAQQSVTDEVLKSLWLQRLPPQLQAILSASSHDLEQLSQLAVRSSNGSSHSFCLQYNIRAAGLTEHGHAVIIITWQD